MNGDAFVVVEIATLGVRIDMLAGKHQRQHGVCLFAYLAAIDAQWMQAQQQRLIVRSICQFCRHPRLVEKAVVLGKDMEFGVDRQMHRVGGTLPLRHFAGLQIDARGECGVIVGMRCGHLRCDGGGVMQMTLRHAVGVMVVVDQCGIFVGTGDFVDAESTILACVEVADGQPDPGRLEQHLGTLRQQEGVIAGGIDVQADRPRDVGIDVVLRRAAGKIRRAFITADRAPRVQRTARMIQFARMQTCAVECLIAVGQHAACELRCC